MDQRALRVDRVTVLERGAPNSVCLAESGKVLPDVRVAIVHPDTKVPCAHTDLGEVHMHIHVHVYMYGVCSCAHNFETKRTIGVKTCGWLITTHVRVLIGPPQCA